MNLAESIGNNIKKLMKLNSVSTTDLANELSITRQTLLNYLKGASVIDSVKLVEVAKFFSVPVTELLEENSDPKAFLFRTALHKSDAHDTFNQKISLTIDSFFNLAKSLGKKVSFFPEQYNLSSLFEDTTIDINYGAYTITKKQLSLNEQLKNDIKTIAHEQRSILGITDGNALNAISQLQKRGINIFFVDFGETETNGLSYVDDEKGCYIIINNNSALTLERIIFTVFHEYAHILLHRPFYTRKQLVFDENKSKFLDKMADLFAGYFLVPQEQLSHYMSSLSSNPSFIDFYPIKHHFQVSLQTLVMALKNYNYISPLYVNRFYALLKKNNLLKSEPYPLIDIPYVRKDYENVINKEVLTVLQSGYIKGFVDSELVQTILWLNEEDAIHTISQFTNYNNPDLELEEFLKEIL